MLEVGGIFAKAELRLDDDGFRRFDRRLDQARRQARDGVEADARLDVDGRGFDRYSRQIDQAERDSSRFSRTAGRMGGVVKGAAVAAGAAAVGGVFALGLGFRKAMEEAEDAARVTAQTEAVLKSTGGAANVTAGELENLAGALSLKAAMDDEAIQSAGNLLLTFTKVRNEAGAGNDVFNQGVETALDLSVALETDLRSATLQLGKALNDPIKGVTALGRAGVQFTADQKDTIRTLVEENDLLGAQRIILEEVQTQVAGSAEAQARPLERAKVAVDNLFEALGARLAPTVSTVANGVARFVTQLESGEGAGGRFRRIMEGIAGAVRDAGAFVGNAFTRIRAAFSGGDASATSFARNVRRNFAAVVAFVRGVASDIADAFQGIQPSLSIIARRIGQLAEFLGAVFRRALPGIRQTLRGLANVIRGVIDVIAGILTLDFGRAWDGARRIVSGAVRYIVGIVRTFTSPFREAMSRLGDAVEGIFGGAWDALKSIVRGALSFVLDGIDNLLSIIEDMLRLAGRIPGVGDKFDDLADSVAGARDRVDSLRDSINGVKSKTIKINADASVTFNGRRIQPLRPLNELRGGQGDGWGIDGSIEDLVRATAQDTAQGAFDRGILAPAVSGTGLNAFNPLATMFGLTVGSGFRGGSRTRSGNLSWHARGRARDFPGAPGAMMAFAQYMAAVFGPRLLELIYTPLGFSIKNGQRVPPYAQADHFDHVHVAMREGGRVGPSAGGARAFIAGEGRLDEWVISQEGDRRRNVAWAREALEALTGRRVELAQGGRGPDRIPATKVRGGSRRIGRNVRRRERGLRLYEERLEDWERDYDLAARQVDADDSELVVERDDGTFYLDTEAVGRRAAALTRLIELRDKIIGELARYSRAVSNLMRFYRGAISRLRKALRAAKGRKRAKRRQGYRDLIGDYTDRLVELGGERAPDGIISGGLFKQLEDDLAGQRIDRGELVDERTGVLGTTAPAAEPVDAGIEPVDLGPAPGEPAPEPAAEPAPAAPTAEQIAAGAAEQASLFEQGRRELFAGFGANYRGRSALGGGLFTDPTEQAAGVRAFGATGAGDTLGGATIINNYAAPPPDPHTWSEQQRFNIEAMAG